MTPTTPSIPDPSAADEAVTGASRGPADAPRSGSPTTDLTEDVAADLGQQAASRLIQAAATAGQTVFDLDDDPSLRHAATSHGCHYELVPITAAAEPDPTFKVRADLLVVRWPRPDGRLTWMTRAPETMRAIRGLLTPAGLTALVLEPTPIEAFTITWTGILLSAAAAAGLTILQDVICLHVAPAEDEHHDALGQRAQHRVILVLRAPSGRHVAADPDVTAANHVGGEDGATDAESRRGRRGWTSEQIHNLGMTTDLETAADIIGIGRTLAYELIKNDEFPVRLLRLGRRVLVPVPELLQLLGPTSASSGTT
jgi:hypothetical protein